MENARTASTPMMAQWEACKKQAGDAILFFRLGDFYECFYEDAHSASKELEITLTQRQSVPMAGIPHHQSEVYIEKLVRRGYNVAVAEQMEDPQQAKGIVERKVVRIVTPGTIGVQEKNNLFFATLSQVGSLYALAYLDLSTGEFRTSESEELKNIFNELYRLKPAELLVSQRLRTKEEKFFQTLTQHLSCKITVVDNWRFAPQLCTQTLLDHFNILSLDGFGLHSMPSSISAAGGLLAHIKETLCQTVNHITEIKADPLSNYLQLDVATQSHLELTESLYDGSKRSTLLSIIDQTCTPMGARLMRHWIKQPLLDPQRIYQRQEGVAALMGKPQILFQIRQTLSQIRDLERLITRVSNGNASPRDLAGLKYSLMALPELKLQLEQFPFFAQLAAQIDPLYPLVHLLASALVDEPPARLTDGRVLRDGYNKELDELRSFNQGGKEWIAAYQNQLKENLQIKTLKIGYTRLFGYYIEVSKSQTEKMPPQFERRQTLVNAERYITQELKEYESKILHAEEKIARLEAELFSALRAQTAAYANAVMHNAQSAAQLDCLASFAECALKQHYSRPIVDNSTTLEIIDGRHPVLEVQASSQFIPNSSYFDAQQRMMLLTGPNMAGKSTYIRQVALIVLLAQIGSFVPARSAHIGIVDKIFSRIGANDNLARGQSTFMVEMSETANILNNATERSLVILDEIGRGTSTYDGISIAYAVAEFLLMTPGAQAKTLFATHYSELMQLEEKLSGVKNYQMAISESENGIVFLRKVIPGGTNKSYGIHVAQLAGMPQWVIHRAQDILKHLEAQHIEKQAPQASNSRAQQKQKMRNTNQLHLF